MNVYRLLFSASPRLSAPQVRSNAEVVSGIILFRILTLSTTFTVEWLLGGHDFNLSLFLQISGLNAVAYGFSRSRFHHLATIIFLVEPLVMLPLRAHLNPDSIESIAAAIWLGTGPVVSTLVLSAPWAIADLLGTLVAYGYIASVTPHEYTSIAMSGFFFIFQLAVLTLVGLYLRSRARRALEAERAKHVQASKLAGIGEMASGIAHELNSPLGAIVLNIELAIETIADSDLKDKEEVLESLHGTIETATRMSTIIAHLKAFARDADAEPYVNLTLDACINDAVALWRERLATNGIEIRYRAEDFRQPCLMPRTQLAQAISNLLANSFEAVRERSEKWIQFTLIKHGAFMVLAISDSGQKPSPEIVGRMFEPFFTTKDFGRGAGLGLSVAKGIAQDLGGDLFYNSHFPQTCFEFHLPIRDARHVRPSDSTAQKDAA